MQRIIIFPLQYRTGTFHVDSMLQITKTSPNWRLNLRRPRCRSSPPRARRLVSALGCNVEKPRTLFGRSTAKTLERMRSVRYVKTREARTRRRWSVTSVNDIAHLHSSQSLFAFSQIEKDGNVSILRIRDVTSREAGEIRCTASASGKGPSIGCVAKLRLQHSSNDLANFAMRSESGQSYAKLSPANTGRLTPERIASMLKRRERGYEESPTRVRSSSFPRRAASSCAKYASPLPMRKRTNNAPTNARKSRFDSDPSARRIAKQHSDDNKVTMHPSGRRSSSKRKDAADDPTLTSTSTKMQQPHDRDTNDTASCTKNRAIGSRSESPRESNEPNDKEETARCRKDRSVENAETRTEEPTKATIVQEPSDVTVFKGNRAIMRVTYQGRPEPTVKWLRVVRTNLPVRNIDLADDASGARGTSASPSTTMKFPFLKFRSRLITLIARNTDLPSERANFVCRRSYIEYKGAYQTKGPLFSAAMNALFRNYNISHVDINQRDRLNTHQRARARPLPCRSEVIRDSCIRAQPTGNVGSRWRFLAA